MKLKTLFGSMLAAVTLLASCSDSNDSLSADGTGRLVVRMTDAPFPYDLVDQANVTVFKVEARRVDDSDDTEGEEGGSPYVVLMEEEIEMNLLDLVNGVTMELADAEVPAGTYDLVRVYVKGIEVVLTDTRTFDLKVPSGEQTGIKVFIEPGLTVTSGLSTDLLLDFDVSSSFVARGNLDNVSGINGFNFKPVIRATNESVAGTLAGQVTFMEEETETPLEGAQITVLQNDEVVATTPSDADGNYAFPGLLAGTYQVVAEATDYLPGETVEVQIDVANITRQDFLLEKDPAAVEPAPAGN